MSFAFRTLPIPDKGQRVRCGWLSKHPRSSPFRSARVRPPGEIESPIRVTGLICEPCHADDSSVSSKTPRSASANSLRRRSASALRRPRALGRGQTPGSPVVRRQCHQTPSRAVADSFNGLVPIRHVAQPGPPEEGKLATVACTGLDELSQPARLVTERTPQAAAGSSGQGRHAPIGGQVWRVPLRTGCPPGSQYLQDAELTKVEHRLTKVEWCRADLLDDLVDVRCFNQLRRGLTENLAGVLFGGRRNDVDGLVGQRR